MEVLDKIKAGEPVTGAELMGALSKEFGALRTEGLVDFKADVPFNSQNTTTADVVVTVLNVLDARRRRSLIECNIN